MAEVHGNRTHPGRYQRPTPDLKSGSPTSELCTSRLKSGVIIMVFNYLSIKYIGVQDSRIRGFEREGFGGKQINGVYYD